MNKEEFLQYNIDNLRNLKLNIITKYNMSGEKELSDEDSDMLQTIDYILNFCKYLITNRFNKAFLEFMFGYNLDRDVDLNKFTNHLLNEIRDARKNFPRK